MSSARIELSNPAAKMADKLSLDRNKLTALIGDILEVCARNRLNVGGNVVCGLDVNGPVVDCDDSELTPYPGSSEAISYLIAAPGIEVTLCTGWDLNTMEFFKENRLKVENLGTVGEYGMVYERRGQFRYLYPYNEQEAFHFVKDVLETAAEQKVKVAFQGNYSTGAGAIYIEGDRNGNLLQHPLVKGRRPGMARLAQAFNEHGSKAEYLPDQDKIVFSSALDNLRGLYQALIKVHPLISLRVEAASDKRLAVRIDEKDREGFDFESLKAVVPAFEKRSGRKALVYEDFGVDLIAPAVEKGNYSKDSGLRKFGQEAFGSDDFLSIIIGDKRSDIPKNLAKTVMAAQKGTSAETIAREEKIPSFNPIDVRDFCVAVSEANRIAKSL